MNIKLNFSCLVGLCNDPGALRRSGLFKLELSVIVNDVLASDSGGEVIVVTVSRQKIICFLYRVVPKIDAIIAPMIGPIMKTSYDMVYGCREPEQFMDSIMPKAIAGLSADPNSLPRKEPANTTLI